MEIRRGNGSLGRVVALGRRGVASVRLADVDGERVIETSEVVVVDKGLLVEVPGPAELRRQVAVLKRRQLATLAAKPYRGKPEPSIREYPATLFFPHRGWDT